MPIGTPVIPSSYQTNRQDLCDALEALIDAFIVSENYEIGRVFLMDMPDTFTAEGPTIAIGEITESVVHDMQTRTTTFSGSLFWLDVFPSHEEYRARVNTWADHMRDLFTENPSIVNAASGVLEQVAFMEDERQQGAFTIAAPHVDFVFRIQEGYR